jgi:hypothetical protein
MAVTTDRADLGIRDLVLTRLDFEDLLVALSLGVSGSRHEINMQARRTCRRVTDNVQRNWPRWGAPGRSPALSGHI